MIEQLERIARALEHIANTLDSENTVRIKLNSEGNIIKNGYIYDRNLNIIGEISTEPSSDKLDDWTFKF